MHDFNDVSDIHQVILVDGLHMPEVIPPALLFNSNCARSVHPEARYKIWSGDMLRTFLANEFDPEVLWAFDTLAPYSYKCDLARFCLLYVYGGLYVDLGVCLFQKWAVPQQFCFATFRDVPFVTSNWATMQTGLIWSRPKRPEFKHAISFIVDNCRKRNYGRGPLYPTGPVVFGKAVLAAALEQGPAQIADQWIGSCQCVTPENEIWNVTYVSPIGELVAYRNKTKAGDLSHMGLKGGNNYNQLWRARRAYGERSNSWSFSTGQNVRQALTYDVLGLHVPLGTNGQVTWGPYVDLPAGDYQAVFSFSPETIAPRIRFDICSNSGKTILHEGELTAPLQDSAPEVRIDFSLDQDEQEIECRLNVFTDFVGVVETLRIRPVENRCWPVTHPKIEVANGHLSSQGIRISRTVHGLVCYGPYTNVSRGDYVLEIQFAEVQQSARQIDVDVAIQRGNKILVFAKLSPSEAQGISSISVPFSVVECANDLEFRVYAHGSFEGVLQEFRLVRKCE